MPSITYTSSYKKNTGLVMSPVELMEIYFFGVKVVDSNGNEMPDSIIQHYIEAAQKEVENKLKIKFKKQLFNDGMSYYRDSYKQTTPRINTRYPVNTPLSLTGFYRKIEQISYPKEWLGSSRNDDGIYMKRMSIVPTSGSAVGTSQDILLTGITSSFFGSPGIVATLPDYWELQYVTGFDVDHYPSDIINVVGMMAAIPVLAIAGDLILGAGIASQSLSIDNISQSINSTASATNSGYGARIIEYRKSIEKSLDAIARGYKGLPFDVF